MLTDTDRLDILEVVARADDAATRRDADAYVTFFTDDAVLDGDKGEHRGKEQLRRSVGQSQLMILRNESPVSIASLSFITQHLVRMGSHWMIERRSVRSG